MPTVRSGADRRLASLIVLFGFIASAGLVRAQTVQGDAWLGPWTRAANEPVIRPQPDAVFPDPIYGKPVHWKALHTFNPAAIVREGKVYVLYRAEDDSGSTAIGAHVSRLGLAVSNDGVHSQQMPNQCFTRPTTTSGPVRCRAAWKIRVLWSPRRAGTC